MTVCDLGCASSIVCAERFRTVAKSFTASAHTPAVLLARQVDRYGCPAARERIFGALILAFGNTWQWSLRVADDPWNALDPRRGRVLAAVPAWKEVIRSSQRCPADEI
jgi:hypothetical protein